MVMNTTRPRTGIRLITGGSGPSSGRVRDDGFAVRVAVGPVVVRAGGRADLDRRWRVSPPDAEAAGDRPDRGARVSWQAVRPPAASSVQAVAVTVRAGGRSAIGIPPCGV
ncbi:hypothetical protein GCM10023191_049330 [Actinoallomurus oryzae]|uniref:Uncharacterized protein n=1 Tax=Actinoallomurus oryzae TaxID=502180 RepID=A0ABP8QFR6_9ACTN